MDLYPIYSIYLMIIVSVIQTKSVEDLVGVGALGLGNMRHMYKGWKCTYFLKVRSITGYHIISVGLIGE